MCKYIQVYKASAGSGKTYSLVYEYIKYLFMAALPKNEDGVVADKKQRKNVHRGVLAVTFTNKSTAEMKERIVLALDKLSLGRESQYESNLMRDIWGIYDGDDKKRATIKAVSRDLLVDILQDYSSFRVSTIDGFFQQVVRSFARELNLDNQYQVELDQSTLIEMAVDNMFSTLHEKYNKDLLERLTKYSRENSENAKSWNPRNSIVGLAKLISSEEYLSNKDRLKFDGDKLKNYTVRLKDIILKFESDAKDICEEAFQIINSDRIDLSSFNKTNIKFFNFDSIKSKKFVISKDIENKVNADNTRWLTAKSKKDTSCLAVADELQACALRLIKLLDTSKKEYKDYMTAKFIYANIYILGILNEIEDNALKICRAKDCMVLSSTTDFINKIIANSDIPFIYEKVGVNTDHFMIDEFQDTSQLQWKNFIPLLGESVSKGQESMLVGDVKQSIYRWRNGDWKILHKEVSQKFKDTVSEVNLEYNYRSAKEIIEFNNLLYDGARSIPGRLDYTAGQSELHLPVPFSDIYANASQKVNPKNHTLGYVNCKYITKEGGRVTDADLITRNVDSLVEDIKRLGTYKGVAVLVRTNKEAQLIADRFKIEKIPFYSSQALCVAENPAVKFIETVMRYVNQPYESVYRASLLTLYKQVCLGEHLTASDHISLSNVKDLDEWETKIMFSDVNLTEEENHKRKAVFDNLKSYPLIRMIQTIDSLFKLSEIDDCYNKIYVQSFIDYVHEYSINNPLDIYSFLNYWKDKGESVFLSMPEGDDAVRIMTIFKSKGLEFDIVFVPFITWTLGVSDLSNTKLIDTGGENNSVLDEDFSVIPINTRSSKNLFNTYFCNHIIEEFVEGCLDVLNVFYVATTRAESQLYMYFIEANSKEKESSEDSSADNKIKSIALSKIVHQILSEDERIIKNEDLTEFEYGGDKGHFVQPEVKEKNKLEGEVESRDLIVNYDNKPTEEDINCRAQLNYKYSEDSNVREYSARKNGIMMHKLFERIKSESDVEEAVESLVREGEILEPDSDKFIEKINRVFNIKGVREWYSDKWQVLNEIELFVNKGKEIYRPDRVIIDDTIKSAVVIDYKFGEKSEELHKRYTEQVKRYMDAIETMGYTVKGYLLYAAEEIVDEIF